VELLNDMALFVEVVKARGFRHAAEAVGMPNSTVSRRISALEKAIGLRLLHRTTRKIERDKLAVTDPVIHRAASGSAQSATN
jgi:hypothetical protein